ncbi:MAG: hypothetical protein ACLQKA_01440 [Bryobacteraceae bacterium]
MLYRVDSRYVVLASGGLGLFLLALAGDVILDVWLWWILRRLEASRFEKLRRARWTILYLGAVGLGVALFLNKTNPPDWLMSPSLALFGIGVILHFIVVLWSHFRAAS